MASREASKSEGEKARGIAICHEGRRRRGIGGRQRGLAISLLDKAL